MVQSWVIFWCRPVTNLHKPTLTPLAGEPFGRMMAETPIKSSLQKKIFFVQMWATWLVVSSVSGVLQCTVWCDWISRNTDLCPSRSAQNKLMLLLPEVGLLGNKINTSKVHSRFYWNKQTNKQANIWHMLQEKGKEQMARQFMWFDKTRKGGVDIMAFDTWLKPSPPWVSREDITILFEHKYFELTERMLFRRGREKSIPT